MDLGISGRWAIVCAASKGLGLACAQALAKEGVNLVINARGDETLQAAALALRQLAPTIEVRTVAGDISEASVRAQVLAACPQVDILVNNAGGPPPGDFRDWQRDDWLKALDANMLTPIELIKACVDGMAERGFGRIVNITSGTAFKGAPFMLDYVASKGALMTMTRALARELGKDMITVNAVSPGYTLSEGNLANKAFLDAYREAAINTRALPRDGWPADIVGAVAFLASDDAGFVSGQILAVDGGSVYH